VPLATAASSHSRLEQAIKPYPVLLAILFGVEANYLVGMPVSSAVNSGLTAG
jgi:hypothetical protein